MNKSLVGTIVGATLISVGSTLSGALGKHFYDKQKNKKQDTQLDEVAATEMTQEETTKL